MEQKNIYIAAAAGQTKKLGGLLAKAFLSRAPGPGAFVVTLAGDLGAGKTQFVQGIAKGLGIGAIVNSPTFSIMKRYEFGAKGFPKTFYHIDCYRLSAAGELAPLGLEKIFGAAGNFIAIEWQGVAKDFLPSEFLAVDFEVIGKNRRRITMEIINNPSKK